jgi:hypothetical protein
VDVALLRLVVVLLVGAAASPGCFDPRQPGCAFSCATDGMCPASYRCADDGLCHRDDGQGSCMLLPQIDAAQDAGSEAGTDGPVD